MLLGGTVHIDSAGGASGILCDCCSTVISASQFEAHAGAFRLQSQGARPCWSTLWRLCCRKPHSSMPSVRICRLYMHQLSEQGMLCCIRWIRLFVAQNRCGLSPNAVLRHGSGVAHDCFEAEGKRLK